MMSPAVYKKSCHEPGSTGPVRFTGRRRLYKGSSEAYTGILAAVPVCTAECRSVRVTRVLDASGNLIVLVLCWLLGLPSRPPGRW